MNIINTSIIENNNIFNDTAIDELPEHWAEFAEAAKEYIGKQKKENTRIAYKKDFKSFVEWCKVQGRGVSSMPASPNVVTMFLADLAKRGYAVSTIQRRCAAIRFAHQMAGHEPPTSASVVKALIGGIKNECFVEPVKKSPITPEDMVKMLSFCPKTLRGARDLVVLALGFAGAFRRSEPVSLHYGDIKKVKHGYIIKLRYSKTGPRIVAILNGKRILAADALDNWLDISGITEGFLLRRVLKGGKVGDKLSNQEVAKIIKKYGALVGLDPDTISGHSLRSGFLSAAGAAGANTFKMINVSGHGTINSLIPYVHSYDIFQNHAGESFL